jgi:site-specific DNA-methyltransferase (adenine-specific)
MNIIQGDCLEKLKELEDNSIDSIVTDPPYGLSFMGKKWDYDVPSQEIWEECLRVLKPGGYLLAFAGTRTQHRMAVRIEDAGFEIRDMIAWVYGSGFPKSLNIGKAVDKLQGNEREFVGDKLTGGIKRPPKALKSSDAYDESRTNNYTSGQTIIQETKGTSPYEGYGTALKPALEPITVARKPISEKTVARNVLKWGTGGINIDGCRVEYTETNKPIPQLAQGKTKIKTNNGMYGRNSYNESKTKSAIGGNLSGRFPANLIHDGSDEVVGLFPNTKGGTAVRHNSGGKTFGSENEKPPMEDLGYADSGSASRFFYCAKASKSERNKGCEELEEKLFSMSGGGMNAIKNGKEEYGVKGQVGLDKVSKRTNHHPTVKPISLMRYLCKLVTPKGGIVLDPFMGSGTTEIGAKLEGFDFIGIEREAEYIRIAEARINAWEEDKQKKLIG